MFITGASRGIGKAIALKAAADGANIVVAAKTADPHVRDIFKVSGKYFKMIHFSQNCQEQFTLPLKKLNLLEVELYHALWMFEMKLR